MPSCFALYYKANGEQAMLNEVDTAMCQALGVEPDPERWYKNWYNTIGLGLAIGHDLNRLREFFPDKLDVIAYLEEYYTTKAWKEWKR